MKSRIGTCVVALTLCATATVSAQTREIPVWTEDAVARWEACGKLEAAIPLDHPMTRGELSVLLDSVLPPAEEGTYNSYTDLNPGTDQADAMLRLVAAGLLHGDGAGRLYPDKSATRQELATLLFRAFPVEYHTSAAYMDADSIAPWATDAVASLQQAGIMVGSNGSFLPNRQVTYGEALQTISAALSGKAQLTGITVETRDQAGVLAAGQPGQANDGKFAITAVETSRSGYVIRLQGLEPLAGEQADANGPGAPATGGKWMGLCLTFHGLVCVDDLEYSLDGVNWTELETNQSLEEGIRKESVMLYVNGAETSDAEGQETEKTRTLTVRQADGTWSTRLTIHYTPAD